MQLFNKLVQLPLHARAGLLSMRSGGAREHQDGLPQVLRGLPQLFSDPSPAQRTWADSLPWEAQTPGSTVSWPVNVDNIAALCAPAAAQPVSSSPCHLPGLCSCLWLRVWVLQLPHLPAARHRSPPASASASASAHSRYCSRELHTALHVSCGGMNSYRPPRGIAKAHIQTVLKL